MVQESIKQYPQSVAGTVFCWDTLDVDCVKFEPLRVLRLCLPAVLHLIGLNCKFARVHDHRYRQKGDHSDHQHVEPAPIV